MFIGCTPNTTPVTTHTPPSKPAITSGHSTPGPSIASSSTSKSFHKLIRYNKSPTRHPYSTVSNPDTPVYHRLRTVQEYQDYIDEVCRDGKPDLLYDEFWRITRWEPMDVQRQIWTRNNVEMESIYRAMNSPYPPHDRGGKSEGTYSPMAIRLPSPGNVDAAPPRSTTTTTETTETETAITSTDTEPPPPDPPTDALDNVFLQYQRHSHKARLLQMHDYFESVLGLQIAYHARIALLVALCSAGDMITAKTFFDKWMSEPLKDGKPSVGNEMYSVMIRGLVGKNAINTGYIPFSSTQDSSTAVLNGGVTQMYAALEQFYDMIRQGRTPQFEIYHSLIVGLSTLENDMEGAEMLLDHMIMLKGRPYGQVLHVIIREYARRRDFISAERIFSLQREYNLDPKAVTCNVMLTAIFTMSLHQAEQYLQQSPEMVKKIAGAPDPLVALKRVKSTEMLDLMRKHDVVPTERTASILIYGFGHFPPGEGHAEIVRVVNDLRERRLEPNLVILNSLVYAYLHQGNVNRSEKWLDKLVNLTHKIHKALLKNSKEGQVVEKYQQKPSPFQYSDRQKKGLIKDKEEFLGRSVLGKGPFHALMLAFIEEGKINAMERILIKMKEADEFLHHVRARMTPQQVKFCPVVNLRPDEHTAKILLLGYLTARDFEKAEKVQQEINKRQDWSHLHQTVLWKEKGDLTTQVNVLKGKGYSDISDAEEKAEERDDTDAEEAANAWAEKKTVGGLE
ncbi:hypothetical protein BGZ94_004796 [Podila epigama]|nr:hypothetical protein BGZ94_004796 [Podila epigama]